MQVILKSVSQRESNVNKFEIATEKVENSLIIIQSTVFGNCKKKKGVWGAFNETGTSNFLFLSQRNHHKSPIILKNS